MPSEKLLEQKVQQAQELKNKIDKAKSIVFVDYRGLTVSEIDDLRNKLRKGNIEYKVIKNTLIMFAVKDGCLKDLQPYLNGPTAVAISYDDEISTSKVISEYAKNNEKLQIKVGVVDGKIINVKDIEALAKIPSKEILISKMLGSFNAPISGFVNVLNANIRGLVMALNEVAKKKQ